MTILVTGGGGFIGRSIVKALLDRGDAVRTLARGDYPRLRELGVDVRRGDLASAADVRAAIDGCEGVFHVAARFDLWGRYEDFYATNTLGTHNVIEACRAAGVGKLVFTSTPSVVHGGDARWPGFSPAAVQAVRDPVAVGVVEVLGTLLLRPHDVVEAAGVDEAGRLEEAEKSLQRSYQMDPSNPSTSVNLAEVLLRRGEAERARFHIRRVNANANFVNAQTLWLAARIERKLGNASGLQELGQQLMNRFPETREAVAYQRGQFDE